MAITEKRVITGTAGGESGITNVGTGTDVTWATSSYPTYANTGLIFDSTEPPAALQSALLALAATTAARGTLTAWDSGDPTKTKPSFATGPSFVELDLGVTNQKVAFIAGSTATALNSTATDGASQAEQDFEAGYGWSCSLQLWFDPSTFSPVTTVKPAHNPTSAVLCSGIESLSVQFFQTRATIYNKDGFRPGALMSMALYLVGGTGSVGTPTTLSTKGGSNASNPWCHFPLNEWVQFGQRMKRATGADAKDGLVQTFVNGALVSQGPSADVWMTTASRMERFFGLLNEYVGLDSIKVRYAAPIQCRVIPDADVATAFPPRWELNTAKGMDLRRLWPCTFVGYPMTLVATVGSPTLPTVGRHAMAGGAYPGRSEFAVNLTDAQTTKTTTPAIWGGDADDTPFGSDGRCHISVNRFCPNGGTVIITLYDDDGNTPLHSVVFDDSGTGTLTIDGLPTLSGRTALPAHQSWQVVFSVGNGLDTVVSLHRVSGDAKDSTLLRTFVVDGAYLGGGIGQLEIEMTGASGGRVVSHSSVSVHSSYTLLTGDSWTNGLAGETYSISSITGGNTINVSSSMGSRAPAAGSLVYLSGTTGGVNDGYWVVSSSTTTTIVCAGLTNQAGAGGTADLCAPRYATSAQRIGMYIPDRSDADGIPGGYDPMPYGHDHALAGFHVLVDIARQGGRLSEDLANVLPQCGDIPNPKVLAIGYDVNDAGSPASESASITKAEDIAADKLELCKWVVGRGGRIFLTSSPSLYPAGVAAGWSNRYYRRTTGRVWDQVVRLVRQSWVARGTTLLDVVANMDAGTFTMSSDGIHPDSASAPVFALTMHNCLEALGSADGYAADGTSLRVGGSGRTGAVGSAVGPA